MNLYIFSLTILGSIILSMEQNCIKHGHAPYSIYTSSSENSALIVKRNPFDATTMVEVGTTNVTKNRKWTMQFYECPGASTFIYYTLSSWFVPNTYLADDQSAGPGQTAVVALTLTPGAANSPVQVTDPRLFRYSFKTYIDGHLLLAESLSLVDYGLHESGTSVDPLWSYLPVIDYIGKTVEPFSAQLVECVKHSDQSTILGMTREFILTHITERGSKNVTIHAGISSFELGRHCGKNQRDKRNPYLESPDTCDTSPCPCRGTSGCNCELEFLIFNVQDVNETNINSPNFSSRNLINYTAVVIRIPQTDIYLSSGPHAIEDSDQLIDPDEGPPFALRPLDFQEYPIVREPNPKIFTQSGMDIILQKHVDRRFFKIVRDDVGVRLQSILDPDYFLGFRPTGDASYDVTLARADQAEFTELGRRVIFTLDLDLVPTVFPDPDVSRSSSYINAFENFVFEEGRDGVPVETGLRGPAS